MKRKSRPGVSPEDAELFRDAIDGIETLADGNAVLKVRVRAVSLNHRDLKVAKLYDMLPAEADATSEGRTAANNENAFDDHGGGL